MNKLKPTMLAELANTKPLLKWAGGKTQLLGELLSKMPKKYGRYIEPFFGGGALFFAVRPVGGIIADSNPERLDIIPMTLFQFKAFFEALFTSGRVEVELIRELLDLCGELRPEHEAPIWKQKIEQIIQQRIAHLHSDSSTH